MRNLFLYLLLQLCDVGSIPGLNFLKATDTYQQIEPWSKNHWMIFF